MSRIHLAVLFLWWSSSTGGQEFRRMPDLRGQSFGLENFLMQPFNLAAQAEEATPPVPRRRDRIHLTNPYTVEFQVQGDDFDMKKIVPTAPRAPLVVNHNEPSHNMKPVHEFAEPPMPPMPPPPRIRQTHGEANAGRVHNAERRRTPVETRKPLERPSEFQLVAPEDEQPPPERHRKRVMKRRRKKPTTPQPIPAEEDSPEQTQKAETAEEIELNIFTDNNEPEVHKTSFYIEHDRETPDPKQERGNEVRPNRRKPQRKESTTETPKENIEEVNREIIGDPFEEDKVVGAATMVVAQQELPLTRDLEEKEEMIPEEVIPEVVVPEVVIPTTETPQEPTHRLKTLLKQQNGQLSLSELLQTQNLSLADFLKGNPGALSALGANKVQVDKTTEPPEIEKPKFQPSRTHSLPKISPKSRPFSKVNHTKPVRKLITTTMVPPVDLPKKLDIIEVTSDRPTYNGFAPKNPRTRPPFYKHDYKPNLSREKIYEETSESMKNVVKTVTDEDPEEEKEEQKEKEKEKEKEIPPARSTLRTPIYRLTTLAHMREATIAEHRVVPKRYGDYRPKLRVDRRKTTTEATDTTSVTEFQDTSRATSTTEELQTQEPKNRVRIPFMSVNNPEISVILPNKKHDTSTTEKPKDRYNMRERLNLFKRINPDEKLSQFGDNLFDTRLPETTEAMTTTASTSTTTTATTTTTTTTTAATTQSSTMAPMSKATEMRTHRTTTEIMRTTVKGVDREEKKENSDEIVELLRTGNNAQRLERILATRNMTLDELLEKRARSSKEPNVTHLFENQTDSQLNGKDKITELDNNYHPTTEKHTTKIMTIKPVFAEFSNLKNERGKVKESIPVVGRPQLESNSFDELFVDESVIRPIKIQVDKDEPRESKAYETTKNHHKNTHRVQLNLAPGTEGKPKHPMPLWNVDEKSIYNRSPYGYPTYDLNKNLAGQRPGFESHKPHEPPTIDQESAILETTQRTPDSNQNLKNNINEILKEQVEVVKEIHEEKTFIPPAVKSAIIASGVVMGIALVVFVAIFAACGWKQRQFRLRARSSILNDSINGSGRKVMKRTGTLSPISFKRTALYKKSIEFEDSESSISGSSNTSSYLWNTLKHTFQSRNSTLKNRQEKEEKIQERENRSRRNTLTREDERSRRNNSMSRDDHHRDSMVSTRDREQDLPRRNTLTREDFRRDSIVSSRRDLSREDTRRSSGYRDDTRRLSTLLREVEPCSFKKIDPERSIIQTSVNFKRGGFNGSSRHFDSCDHFN